MKAVVAAFNQEKVLVGAFSVITNLRMELFEALICNVGLIVREKLPKSRKLIRICLEDVVEGYLVVITDISRHVASDIPSTGYFIVKSLSFLEFFSFVTKPWHCNASIKREFNIVSMKFTKISKIKLLNI